MMTVERPARVGRRPSHRAQPASGVAGPFARRLPVGAQFFGKERTMAHTLTIGKLRGLRQISTEGGIFTMAAEDQRGSMRKMLNPQDPKSVSAAQMTEVKLDIAHALSPLASAMLIDPEFGAAQAVTTGALTGHCGLLVSLEDSDYEQVGDDRRAKILEGWGVAKIKRMGASGVKLLAYFRPDRGPGTTYQRDLIARVGEECQK